MRISASSSDEGVLPRYAGPMLWTTKCGKSRLEMQVLLSFPDVQ